MQPVHRDDDGTRAAVRIDAPESARDRDLGAGLTASEQLIWTGQRLDPTAPLYNMALAIEIAAPVDVPAFVAAFQRLVRETDALRSSFIEVDGHPRRVVMRDVPAHVELLCLAERDHDDASLMRLLEARTRRVFALDGVLFDCCLIERRPDRFVWYLNQHHLITDAWSVGVLHRRMAALYENAADRPVPQFDAFEAYQRSLRGSARLTRALAYWDAVQGSRVVPLYGDSACVQFRSRSRRRGEPRAIPVRRPSTRARE